MGLTKEELIRNLKQVKRKEYGKEYLTFQINVYQMARDILEYFENENTISFKHFHLLADSTLKSWGKEALLDYIHMLYYNWESTDCDYNRTIDYANKLQEELDKLEKQHMKLLSQWGKSDNPPLKLEEVHGYMPLFDTTTNFWIMVTAIHTDGFGGYVFDKENEKLYFNLFTFEENRFYRREVIGDE